MAKHHRKRNYSKKQKRIKEPTPAESKPTISDEEIAQNYRRNTRRTIFGVVGIFFLVFILYIFVAIDVSGCQFVETEEEYENCRSYSLLEKIFYGGAMPVSGETIETEDSEAGNSKGESEDTEESEAASEGTETTDFKTDTTEEEE